MPAPVERPDLLTRLLGSLAAEFTGQPSGDTEIADLLSEVLVSMRLRGNLSRGVYPQRGSVPPPSKAAGDLEAALAAAVRHHRARAAAPIPPNRWPAGLEVPGARVGCDLQAAGSSGADEMTLRQAADLLGLSPERVRLLATSGGIEGWRETGGRHQWHVTRASVIAYKRRWSGEDDPGDGEGHQAA